MQIEERHRNAAQKSIQYLHQVTGFLKGESQHLRKLWVESVAQIIADCEASSDPLAVAVRMERAEAEVARLREALQMVQSYFWGTELPVMKEGDVQQFVEAALRKDGQ